MRIPVLPLVFLFIASFLLDLYISLDVRQIWKKRGVAIYWITAILCYAVLIVGISLPRRDADSGIGSVMWLLFTFCTIYIGKIIYFFCSILGRLFRMGTGIRWNWYPSRLIGVVCGLIAIGVMWIGAGYTRHQIEVTHELFQSPKVPESFNGYKIVQLSDLHVGTWGRDTTFVSNLVDTVNSINPDLIVFTGDIVNRQTGELLPFVEILSRLKSKDGVYSILGNHDYGDYVDWPSSAEKEKNLLQLKEQQRKMGWHLLNNESVFIRNGEDSLLLVGVENWGEPPFPQYGDLNKALAKNRNNRVNQNDSNFKILLSHDPEHWNQEVSKDTNIDLTLSGHTHAMQAIVKIGNWKWSPAQFRYEQWGGRFDRDNENGEHTALYVNTGSGAVGMPARLLAAYPEVTVITLKK